MANKTVYPFGTEGQLPSNIGIVNDRTTGGADKALSAEQGKILDDIIFQMNAYDIYRIDQTEINGWYINSSNTWTQVAASSQSNYGIIFIPITPGKRYTVYGDTTIALLKSTSRVSGEAPDFCDNYEGRIVVSAETFYSFIAPADANYLYFLTKSGGNEKNGSVKYSDADYEAAIRKNTEAIIQFNSKKIDTSSLTPLDGWTISSNGKWYKLTPTENYSSLLVPVTPGKDYTLIGNTTGDIFAVLKSATKSDGGTADFSESYPSRIRVKRYEHFSFTAPSDAAYVYLHTKSSGNEYDSYVAVPEPLYEQLAGVGDDGDVAKVKDGFDTAPEYYAWLKMEQATKIKWTPLKNTIQKPSSTGKFATTEQTGFPYSSAAEYDKRLGADVSIHTFMTAIHNPYSVMYTECIRGDYSRSAYGITYYGATNSGPYYGMVCSGLADYALGGEVPWLTNDLYIDLVTEFGLCEVIFDQSANGMKRGDILCTSGHTRIVKDVWRKNGVVTDVRISEAVQPLVIDNAVKSAANFNTYMAANEIVAVRYKELYKNIHYEPSPYVAVGDETPQTVVYNDDICCFAGDKAAFLEGDLIYIHCLNLDYPQMELYKDNVLVETITLDSDARAAKTSDDLAYAVNLSNDNLGYGMYKARLKNGNDYSDYTYFEVINASVTYADGVATYNSANATAVCWYWQRYHDSQGAKIYDVTPLDGQKSGTIEMTPPGSTWPLLKVLFKGKYGRVAARFLNR
jgi:hypothetical protein